MFSRTPTKLLLDTSCNNNVILDAMHLLECQLFNSNAAVYLPDGDVENPLTGCISGEFADTDAIVNVIITFDMKEYIYICSSDWLLYGRLNKIKTPYATCSKFL